MARNCGSRISGLRIADQLLYALGSLGANALLQAYTLWLIFFYAPPEGIPRPTLVPLLTLGAILTATKAIELIDDPLIGFLSDRTRSPLGRRAPFILGGSPVLVGAFWLLWHPPETSPTFLNAGYLFASLLLFALAFTVVMGPYDALLPELGRTSRTRVNLASLKVLTGLVGAGLGLALSGKLIEGVGFTGMASVISVLALAAFALTLLGIRPRLDLAPPSTLPLRSSVVATLTNRPFLSLVASLSFLFVARDLLIQTLPFFTVLILGGSEGDTSLLTGALIVVTALSLPVLLKLSRELGVKTTSSAAMLALAVYLPTIGLVGHLPLPVPPLAQGIAAVALLGAPVAALYVFPHALLANVVDDDALRTGHRREAMYFGTFATLVKLAPAASGLLLAALFEGFGFTLENPTGVRLAPLAAGMCALIGWAIFQFGYHLGEESTGT